MYAWIHGYMDHDVWRDSKGGREREKERERGVCVCKEELKLHQVTN